MWVRERGTEKDSPTRHYHHAQKQIGERWKHLPGSPQLLVYPALIGCGMLSPVPIPSLPTVGLKGSLSSILQASFLPFLPWSSAPWLCPIIFTCSRQTFRSPHPGNLPQRTLLLPLPSENFISIIICLNFGEPCCIFNHLASYWFFVLHYFFVFLFKLPYTNQLSCQLGRVPLYFTDAAWFMNC